MKKFIVVCVSILSFIGVFTSCTKNNMTSEVITTVDKRIDVDEEYWNAYVNCISYIENSSNSNRGIDTSMVLVELLNEEQKEWVQIISDEDEDCFKDTESEYWLFTIGDTKDHSYILLVCNSQSDKVIGSIPIK